MKSIGQQAYELLLQDPRWKRKSYYIKKRDKQQCVICGKTENLHVHHLNYGNATEPWDVPNEWLATLCQDCHTSAHKGSINIAFPQVGRFYQSRYGNVGIVCKIDKQTSHVIMLSQHIIRDHAPKLSKLRFNYFCDSWSLVDVEETVANWFFLQARRYCNSMATMTESIDKVSQSLSTECIDDNNRIEAELNMARERRCCQ